MKGLRREIIQVTAACFFFLLSLSPSAEANIPDFDYVSILLTGGKYHEALAAYQTMADEADNPDTAARALLLKAVTMGMYLKDPSGALALLGKIRTQYPKSAADPDVLFHMGMFYYNRQQYREAADAFSEYMDQYPNGIRRHSADSWHRSALERLRPAEAPESGVAVDGFRDGEVIRVLIIKNADHLELRSGGKITIRNSGSSQVLFEGNGPVVFTRNKGSLFLNGMKSERLKYRAETSGETISVGNSRFRGSILVALEPDGLQAINQVSIEAYLYGIISREMPSNWASNALKAQAVASRTYALYIKSKNRLMPYDVEATTESQVYGGFDAETRSTNAAVDATRGQVLTRHHQLIIPYFHSNSAGHTEEARWVWQVDLPYLKGITDPFSLDIPNGNWQYRLTYSAASTVLNQAGLNVGAIKSIKPNSYTPSGRVFDVELESPNGKIIISANHFRCLLDAKQIRSTFFKIVPQPGGVLLEGKGHGHGVGMSQWGANQMAASGHSYQGILKFYYSGIELTTLGKMS